MRFTTTLESNMQSLFNANQQLIRTEMHLSPMVTSAALI